MRIKSDKEQALDSCMKMIYKVAHKFSSRFRGMVGTGDGGLEDLTQAGVLGFLTAYDKFDPSRGAKLSSFAYFYIFRAIQSYVAANYGVCRVPHDNINNDFRGTSYEDLIYADDQCSPDTTILSTELQVNDDWLDLLKFIPYLSKHEKISLFSHHELLKEDVKPREKPLHNLFLKCALLKLKRLILDHKISVEENNNDAKRY